MSSHQLPCDDAARLVPSYLDGELSEAQAGPLRKHLLDCVGCRGSAQDLKNLQRWFAPHQADVTVPSGFAARVARRAFAGDTGALGGAGARLAEPVTPVREVLPFVRELVALAAAVLVMLLIGLRMGDHPASRTLRADEAPSLGEITEQLDRMNEAERAELERIAREREVDGERAGN